MIEKVIIEADFPEIKTGEITAGAYLVPTTEIFNSCQRLVELSSVELSSLLITMFQGSYGETSASMCLIHTAKMKKVKYQLQVK